MSVYKHAGGGGITDSGDVMSSGGVSGGVSLPFVTLVIIAINVLVYFYSFVAEGFEFSFDGGASVVLNGGLLHEPHNILRSNIIGNPLSNTAVNDLADLLGVEIRKEIRFAHPVRELNELAALFGMESADLLDDLVQIAGYNNMTGSEYAGIAGGEYYRLITHGFIHADFFHLIFNLGYLLVLGWWLEIKAGRLNFVCIFLVSMLGGACGALLLSPDSITVGASGAIFGIHGSMLALMGKRFWRSIWCGLLIIDIISTFTLIAEGAINSTESEVSIGGHLGGLLSGVLIGAIVSQIHKSRWNKSTELPWEVNTLLKSQGLKSQGQTAHRQAKVATVFASVALSACLVAFAHMITAP